MGKSLYGRNFSIILYQESFLIDDGFLAKYLYDVVEYACILHDSDIDGDGNLKKPHYHVLFRFDTPRSISSVANRFGIVENLVEIVRKWKIGLRYLTHCDYPNKFQYPVSSLLTNVPLSVWAVSEEESLSKIVDDVVFAGFSGKKLSVLFREVMRNGNTGYYLRYYKVFSDIYRQEYELGRILPVIEREVKEDCPKQEKLQDV